MFFKKVPPDIRWIFAVFLIFLISMTFFRVLFYLNYNPVGKPFSGSGFFMGLRFDLKLASILALFIFFVTRIPLFNPIKNHRAQKTWNVLLPVLYILFLVMYAVDFYHYDYLKQRLNGSVLNYLEDAAISFNMMWESYPLVKLLLGILIISAGSWYLFSKILQYYVAIRPVKIIRKFVWYLAAFLIWGGLVFGKFSQFNLRWSDAYTLSDDFKANLALNPFQSFFSSLKYRKSSFDLEKVKAAWPLVSDYLGIKNNTILNFERVNHKTQADSVKPNVILVICESFSMYKSSMVGNPLNTTPFFNELCKNGIFFDRCFTPAYGTARGVWATVTGIPDVEMPRTASRNPAAVNQHTIINDFRGYKPFYFLGGNPTWANIQGLLSNNITGLQLYQQDNFKAKKIDVWGISDKNLLLEASSILGQQTGNFFAIIQTADNHRPYTIPEEDRGNFKLVLHPSDSLRRYGFENNAELNAFRYTDYCFQQFMKAARKEKYYDNTIFVFVGDHGIRGNAGSLLPEVYTKQGLVCEHVPLLFYAPQLLAPKRYDRIASQIDILPSIASLVGITYRNTTLGRDLFDTASSQRQELAFIIDHDVKSVGLVSGQYYYLRNLTSGKEEFVPMKPGIPSKGPAADSSKSYLGTMTNAWFETARYLLLNNKKKN